MCGRLMNLHCIMHSEDSYPIGLHSKCNTPSNMWYSSNGSPIIVASWVSRIDRSGEKTSVTILCSLFLCSFRGTEEQTFSSPRTCDRVLYIFPEVTCLLFLFCVLCF